MTTSSTFGAEGEAGWRRASKGTAMRRRPKPTVGPRAWGAKISLSSGNKWPRPRAWAPKTPTDQNDLKQIVFEAPRDQRCYFCFETE